MDQREKAAVAVLKKHAVPDPAFRQKLLNSLNQQMKSNTAQTTPRSGLFYYDIPANELGLDNGIVRVLQQNPNRSSDWAKLARDGFNVWQVIHKRGQYSRYIGVLVDEMFGRYTR